MLALIGDAGSGKSRALLSLTPAAQREGPACVRIPVPTLSGEDLLRWCLHELGETEAADRAALERKVASLAARSRELLLLVEDADRLPLATAETLGAWLRELPGVRIVAGFYEHAPFEPLLAAIDPRARRIRLRAGEPLEPMLAVVRSWAGLPAPRPVLPAMPPAPEAPAHRPPVAPAPEPAVPQARPTRPPRPARLRRAARAAAFVGGIAAGAALLALLRGGPPPPAEPLRFALAPVDAAPPPAPPEGQAPQATVPEAEAAREAPVGSSEVVVVVPMPGDPAPAPAATPPAAGPGGSPDASVPAPAAAAPPAPTPERAALSGSSPAAEHARAAPEAPPGRPGSVAAAPPAASSAPAGAGASRAEAPGAQAAAPEDGLVRVVVNASPQARIRADGRDFGLTPLADLRLAPGPHHFAATLADGRVVERQVELAGDVVLLFFP